MNPVLQSRFEGDRGGNCFSACVASLLDLPLVEVPDFPDSAEHFWFAEFVDWCAERNVGVIYFPGNYTKGLFSEVLCIESWSITESEEILHSVVARLFLTERAGRTKWLYGSEVIHDPNPDPPTRIALQHTIILQRNT